MEDLAGLKALLRSNNWQREPFSGSSPWNTLCSRGDLDPTHPRAAGCYDAKVTSHALALALGAEAVSGPTDDGVAPFSWKAWPEVAHRGMPNSYAGARFERQQP